MLNSPWSNFMKNYPALLLALWCGAAFSAPDAKTILEQSDRARGGGLPGIAWEIKLNSHDGIKVDEQQRLWVKATDDASVAETFEPARFKGSKLLQVGRNMWLTRPGLSKPIPISPRQRMSGQASNGDIAATNYAKDYEAQLTGEEAVAGEACYVLDLKAKHNRATYDKIRYWVSIKRSTGIKAEFYSVSGKLLKTAHFDYANSIQYDGQHVPFVSRMTIRDAMIDAETIMEFGTVKVQKLNAGEFDLGQLQ
jgi:hypothetical protein